MEGVYNNAAAPAVREPFSSKWVDIDPSVGISLPGAYGNVDFDNTGQKGNSAIAQRTNRFLAYNAGLQVQLGRLGLNVLSDFLNYSVTSLTGNPVSLTLGKVHAVAAYSFFDNQLVIGGGARVIFVNVAEKGTGDNNALVRMLGAAPQLGVIVKPTNVPWRLGATIRAPVEAAPFRLGPLITSSGQTTAGPYVLPEKITEPWELEGGIAYQLGPRPLNPAWINPHDQEADLEADIRERRRKRTLDRNEELAKLEEPQTVQERAARALHLAMLSREEEDERADEDRELREASIRLREERQARYLNWPREHLLMLASVLITGPSSNAVALEGFIDQQRELVGQHVSVAPRFGVESEPIPNLVKGRAGTYFEPSRFEGIPARQHFTVGGDLRLFTWDLFGILAKITWRTSAFIDIAPRYQNFGITIGPWH